MLGRTGEVKPFELIRWARKQAGAKNLKPLEAHVLLLLATYADKECVAWPSLKTLAIDCGLKPSKHGTNSSVSAAIARLEDLQLVWSKQSGSKRLAKRELLYNPGTQPSGLQESEPFQPSAVQESEISFSPTPAFLPDGNEASCVQEQKYQRNGHTQLPEGTARESLPAGRKASHPTSRKAGLAPLSAVAYIDFQRRGVA